MNTSQSKLYEQIEIETTMLKLGMIVDKEERKIIEYDISEAKWSYDLGDLTGNGKNNHQIDFSHGVLMIYILSYGNKIVK